LADLSTFDLVRQLVAVGDVRISEHGYDELAEDDIFVRDLINGIGDATVVEDYPSFAKGPAVLVLQFDRGSPPGPCRVGDSEGLRFSCGLGHGLSP
jgi:hypothetical protein